MSLGQHSRPDERQAVYMFCNAVIITSFPFHPLTGEELKASDVLLQELHLDGLLGNQGKNLIMLFTHRLVTPGQAFKRVCCVYMLVAVAATMSEITMNMNLTVFMVTLANKFMPEYRTACVVLEKDLDTGLCIFLLSSNDCMIVPCLDIVWFFNFTVQLQ